MILGGGARSGKYLGIKWAGSRRGEGGRKPRREGRQLLVLCRATRTFGRRKLGLVLSGFWDAWWGAWAQLFAGIWSSGEKRTLGWSFASHSPVLVNRTCCRARQLGATGATTCDRGQVLSLSGLGFLLCTGCGGGADVMT